VLRVVGKRKPITQITRKLYLKVLRKMPLQMLRTIEQDLTLEIVRLMEDGLSHGVKTGTGERS